MGLFARKSIAGDPVAAVEADLTHKIAERRRIDDQLSAAGARVKAATQAHELALLEDPDNAGALADERNAAQTETSGLAGLLARIDVEIAETEAEVSFAREAAQRSAEANRLEAALADQASAVAEFEPTANKLVATLEAMGAADTASTLKVLLEQARRQIETDRAAIQLRANNLRKPAPIHVPPEIVTPPAPHGEIAHGSRYRGFANS